MGLGMIMPISDRSAYGGEASPRFADMLELTRIAGDIGLDAVWVPDHFVVRVEGDRSADRGVWECWTVVAGLAAATAGRRITIGSFVTCTGFRNPGLIAKMAESVDDISGGRFVLGMGAGWHQPEYDMFGIPFDHRVARFEEAIQIVHPLLREGAADFTGRFFEAREAVNLPRGPRAASGGVPILVGTGGPKMMRLTATYADAWNSDWCKTPADLMPMLQRLDEACQEVGRDTATLIRSSSSNIALPGTTGRRPNPITGGPEEIAEAIDSFRQLGLGHYVCGLDPCTPQSLEYFARVIELLDKNP